MNQVVEVQSADPAINANTALQTENGWVVLPSSVKHLDASRFKLNFPLFYVTDLGAGHLIANEVGAGYEPPTRDLVERVLRPGDLFVDVGAHWGFFTLQAATHPAGKIEVIAFEPELMNAIVLTENVTRNKLSNVTVVCAACGDESKLAPLIMNSTMGHSIYGADPRLENGPSRKWVSLITLDSALANLHIRDAQRIIVKIDAEGFEPNIVFGATSLLRSGRVALVIWECGGAYAFAHRRTAMLKMVAFLSECGFSHARPGEQEGPLIKFDPDSSYHGNVFSFRPELDINPVS
jgi:FkbM family methyltransferase